jgi:hypothetical protein
VIFKGKWRSRDLKSSKFSGLAGAAPQGRRGQGASRPARPGFHCGTSSCNLFSDNDSAARFSFADIGFKCGPFSEHHSGVIIRGFSHHGKLYNIAPSGSSLEVVPEEVTVGGSVGVAVYVDDDGDQHLDPQEPPAGLPPL